MSTTIDFPLTEDALDEVIRPFQVRVPVDVVQIAKNLDLTVYKQPLPDNVSGMIRKDKKLAGASGFAIIVNSDQPSTRQRFTIAHEIAHFLLHRNQIGDGIQDDVLLRSGLSTSAEVAANKLAARILMPLHLLQREMAAGHRTVQELARRFGVSTQAMSIRLGLPQ